MQIQFVGAQPLIEYPSGSTITYYKDKLYLMGDDATGILVLDTALNILDTIPLFSSPWARIDKPEKADIESSEWIQGKLWLFGSGSKSPQRDSAFRFNPKSNSTERVDLSVFYSGLRKSDIPTLNIEGAALIKRYLVFANRGNESDEQNYLIKIRTVRFPHVSAQETIKLNLPEKAGISGVTYLPKRDLGIMTFSQENTANAYDDGDIGESFLGFFDNISKRLSDTTISPDKWVPLSDIHQAFRLQKIESICIIPSGDNKYSIILVSDNDDGETKLFKLQLDF